MCVTVPTRSSSAAPTLFPAPRQDLVLDFINTRYWRGTPEPTDSLPGVAELLDWCGTQSVLPANALGQVRNWVARHPRQADAAFADLVALREELFRLFIATAEGKAAPSASLAVLDRSLSSAARRVGIAAGGGGFVWRVAGWRPDLSGLITPVIWSAADLLLGGRIARVRRCANDQCLWLFLDDSKGGTRRWCSMSACGNRAKAHRHYQKKKGA